MLPSSGNKQAEINRKTTFYFSKSLSFKVNVLSWKTYAKIVQTATLLVCLGCFNENTLCTTLYICGTLPWKAFAPLLASKIKHAACCYTCYLSLDKSVGFMSLQTGAEKFETTTFLGFGKEGASWLALRISPVKWSMKQRWHQLHRKANIPGPSKGGQVPHWQPTAGMKERVGMQKEKASSCSERKTGGKVMCAALNTACPSPSHPWAGPVKMETAQHC